MKFQITTDNILKSSCECVVLPVWSNKKSLTINEIDKNNNNFFSNLVNLENVHTEFAKAQLFFNLNAVASNKILLLGLGEEKILSFNDIDKVSKLLINKLNEFKIKSMIIDLTQLITADDAVVINQLTTQISYHLYQFNEFKTVNKTENLLTEINYFVNKEQESHAKNACKKAIALANGIEATRTIANMPPNICNAKYLANQAKMLTSKFSTLDVSFYDEKEIESLGMNAYLAVGNGSVNESIMSVIEYKNSNAKNSKPIVLVGKGLTFDSGGISIKPSAGMDEMKYDMCGAATVYGVMQTIAELNLPLNVIGIIAGCENMPGNNAYRPGDILTTMSGQTVEVNNTDAEGRLVLADVLTFVERFDPNAVIDIATLTGACIIALGHHYTGVMGNNDELINQLLKASKVANDKAWQLPLDEDFDKQINSNCADIVNSSGRDGGTITAGCFLSRFAKKYNWAHLDIAGTAWVSGVNKCATGRPVSMLVEYLINQAK